MVLILNVTTGSNQEHSSLDHGHWGRHFKVLEDIKHLLGQKLNRNYFVVFICVLLMPDKFLRITEELWTVMMVSLNKLALQLRQHKLTFNLCTFAHSCKKIERFSYLVPIFPMIFLCSDWGREAFKHEWQHLQSFTISAAINLFWEWKGCAWWSWSCKISVHWAFHVPVQVICIFQVSLKWFCCLSRTKPGWLYCVWALQLRSWQRYYELSPLMEELKLAILCRKVK